jgi:multiple sugar transport system permease protein
MILFMAAMVSVPQTYYDAAAVDGANAWQTFWKITVPQIKPVMIYVLVTSLIGGMNNFDIPFVIGEGQNLGTGGPLKSVLTMVMYLYNMAFTGGRQRGYAAAIAFAIFFIVIVCSVIIFKLMSREEES